MSREDSLLHRALARIAGFLYRNSDHIVVVAPALKDYLVERGLVRHERISVITNGVESDRFSPENAYADLRKELGGEGKFVVSYIGTLGMAHGLESLIECAARLQHSAPEVLLVLVGEGAEKERIAALALARGLHNVRFLGEQPREKIPAYIGASDVCLVLLKKTELFKTVIPSKMLEFMSCARPVILGVDGQARKILEQAQAGIFVEPENSNALADAVLRFSGDPELRRSCGENGRRHVLQYYSRQRTAQSYLDLLGSLLGQEHAAPVAWETTATVLR